MQQRDGRQILRRPDTQPGIADQGEPLPDHRLPRKVRERSDAIPDRRVGRARPQIDDIVGSVEAKVERRVTPPEIRHPRHQPFGGEGCGRGEGEDAPLPPRRQLRQRVGEGIEAVAQHGEQPAALRRQRHAPRPPLEQPEAQNLLQKPHLMADRGRRHAQLPGRLLEAGMSRRRFEGAQRRQGRKPSHG